MGPNLENVLTVGIIYIFYAFKDDMPFVGGLSVSQK